MYCSATDCDVNRLIAPGLEALSWHLLEESYSAVTVFDVCHYVLDHGTLEGNGLIFDEDYEAAEAAYVNSLPAVPYDSAEWGEAEPDEDSELWRHARDWTPAGGWSDPDPAGEWDDTGEFPAVAVPVEPPDEWEGNDHAGWTMLPSQARPSETSDRAEAEAGYDAAFGAFLDGPGEPIGRRELHRARLLAAVAAITIPMAMGGSLASAIVNEPYRIEYTDRDYEDWSLSLDADYPPDDQVEDRRVSWDRQTEAWNDARERGEEWAL